MHSIRFVAYVFYPFISAILCSKNSLPDEENTYSQYSTTNH